jgi:hypothetical protein
MRPRACSRARPTGSVSAAAVRASSSLSSAAAQLRAPAYAEGARKGAPQAVRLADRRHPLKDLVDAAEWCLVHHSRAF